MKKVRMVLYTLTLLLTLSNSVRAQDPSLPKTILGIRGGVSLAPTDWSFSEAEIFPTVGIATSFNISKMPLYVESGLYYTNRYVYDYDNHSLLIPALITYHFPVKNKSTVQPFIGPFISYGFDEGTIDGGFRLGVGYNSNKIYINCGYDLSMNYGVDEDALFINIGYNF